MKRCRHYDDCLRYVEMTLDCPAYERPSLPEKLKTFKLGPHIKVW